MVYRTYQVATDTLKLLESIARQTSNNLDI
jgi:hypothetical protein